MAARSKATAKPGDSARVGVRELRQNLSVYLTRVKRGERLEVTEHGRPVAVLEPLWPRTSALEQMVAAGAATPGKGNWAALGPPLPPTPGQRPLSEILQEMRDEERY